MEATPASRFGRYGRPAWLLDAEGGTALALDLGVADGFRLRLLGLMGQAALRLTPVPQALLLRHCRCVHTCFMRAPLDLAFLDAHGTVLALHDVVRPWRLRWYAGAAACHTLELPPGAVKAWGLRPGARLQVASAR